MDTIPKIGQYLFASCCCEDYGKIIAIGKDENGVDTIDIIVTQASNVLSFENADDAGVGYGNSALTFLELEPDTKMIMRDLQWKSMGDGYIECNTPGNDCYRCTKLFRLNDAPFEIK